MEDSQFNIDTIPSLVDAGDLEAIGIAIGATRRVFDVKSLAAGGLTGEECLELLLLFLLYTESQKKSTSDPPTPPLPTESESSESSTMPPDLDCSSMSGEPKSDTPPESSMET